MEIPGQGDTAGAPLALGDSTKDAVESPLFNGALFILVACRLPFVIFSFVRVVFDATDPDFCLFVFPLINVKRKACL